ncbi:MAG: Nudix family hydrolase [Candidatus Thiodiazotropha sp. (ex Epidulcina cf. delphinae)]|nr:Nudix family hydrolase [Candidatus Thiodiazotropha sp. (ex Epidulcina cf. delphinae)]
MTTHVAAAAILDATGRVLVTKRADHRHQGGLWEFPGGKREQGESTEQALARELEEELGIQSLRSEPLIRIRHDYGDRRVLLDVYRVTAYQGVPKGLEGQPLRWLLPAEMEPEAFPAADRPVISALRLPRRYLISGDDATQPAQFLHRLHKALEAGPGVVQLRAHRLIDPVYRDLLLASLEICRAKGAKLLVNRPQRALDWAGEADGIHLTARQLAALTERPEIDGLLGASCHNPSELHQAEGLQLDYALLSPVLPTASHPHAPCLGWDRFRDWVDRVNVPVYALGGMRSAHLRQAMRSGAQGIAAIGAFWGN